MKTVKKLLCIALAVSLCFSLIGCNVIDKMRKNQIHYNENENLVYDNKEYKLLPPCEALSPDFSDCETLYITEEDVPVLVADIFGTAAELSKDKRFIAPYGKTEENYFARSDIYDVVLERINSGDFFDKYLYRFGYYDDDEYEYKTKENFISDELAQLIDLIMLSEPVDDIDISLLYNYEILDIYASSNDKIFSQYITSIYQTDSYIYLSNTIEENPVAYRVPEEFVSQFEILITEYNTLYNEFVDSDDEFID